MTTPDPLDSLVMPYSVTFIPTPGYGNPLLPEGMRNYEGSTRLGIPPAVSIINASWAGEENLRIYQWRDGVAHTIIDIPAAPAGTQRSATSTISYETVTYLTCSIGTVTESSETVRARRRISITVIPFSTPTKKL